MFLFLDCFKCGTAHHDDLEKSCKTSLALFPPITE